MIVTDFNEMGIDVLIALHDGINMEFEIDDTIDDSSEDENF